MRHTGLNRYLPRWFAVMVAASLMIVGYGFSQLDCDKQVQQDQQVQPLNRELYEVIWIDKYPEMTQDKWNAYMFTNDNVGLTIEAHSAYKITLEIFEFKASRDKLRFHFPHDARRADSKYSIEKLKKPTKHFDTKLTLASDPRFNGETRVYFTGPDFRSASTLPSPVQDALEPTGFLKHLLP